MSFFLNMAGRLATTFQDLTGFGPQPTVSREIFLDFAYSGTWCSQNKGEEENEGLADLFMDMLEENLSGTESITYAQAKGATEHALSYVFQEDRKREAQRNGERSEGPTSNIERTAEIICDEAFGNAQRYAASLSAPQTQQQLNI